MSEADEWNFEEIIASIEEFNLGTKIRSETGDIYNLSQAEGIGKRRKFSRWNGTKLRFMTYENIGKKFEILEDNTEEIEELEMTEIINNRLVKEIKENREKINELVKAVNQIIKESEDKQ